MEIELSKLLGAIGRFAAPIAKKQIERNQAAIKLRKDFKLDKFENLPDDFLALYAYTLIEYGLGKEEQLLRLFMREEVKEAFYHTFAKQDFSIFKNGVNESLKPYLDWNTLRTEIEELEIDIYEQLEEFYTIFYTKVLPRTLKPSQICLDQRIQDKLTKLEKLDDLDEIHRLFKEIRQLLKNSSSQPITIKQSDDHVLDKRLEETLKLYLTKSFNEDGFAELDQAGETDPERRTLLKQVFIDLDVKIRQGTQPQKLRLKHRFRSIKKVSSDDVPFEIESSDNLSALDCLLEEEWSKIVIIGSPGQGKSTLGQQLAQVHRAKLLKNEYNFHPQKTERTPFRIVLKYFAQWLADKPDSDHLEAYIAERIGKLASRPGTVSTEDVQEILRHRPSILILDGLDEVVAPQLQEQMLARIQDFIARAEVLDADLMVVATSRPNEYKNQFDPEKFLHLELPYLSDQKVSEYAKKWVLAKNLRDEEQDRIICTLEECQQDRSIAALLKTPLNVTISLLIIKDGGRPPSQREALFYEYWITIFRREKSKARGIIQSDESILFELHTYLGYLLHRRASEKNVRSLLSEEDFRKAVREFLRKKDKRSSEDAINSKMEQLVKEAQERLVLIVAPEPGLFGFELRSFQEFFAAVYLAQTATDTKQRFERLKAIACSEHWRNVALFFVGQVARNFKGEAVNILELVCRPLDRGEPNCYLRPGSWLALEIAADAALGANRDLQYNAVEYGLEVLETGLTEEQQQELISLTKRLSQEDKHDILRPVLEEQLRCLPVGCLEVALNLYGKHFGATSIFQEKIDFLLQAQNKNIILFALNLALFYEAEPLWMVERLKTHWDCLKTAPMSRWFCRSPEYTERLLIVWQLSEAQLQEITEAIFKSPWLYHPIHSEREPIWDLPEPNTLSEQLIVMLRCIYVISYLKRQVISRIEIPFETGDTASLPAIGWRMRCFESPHIPSLPNNITERINGLLQRSDLMPYLRVSLWTLFWFINEPSLTYVSSFLENIRLVKQMHTLFERWWRYVDLDDIWPLLTLAVEQQNIKGDEAVEKLLPFLEAKSQISVAKQVIEVVTEYIAQSDERQKNSFYIAMRAELGLDKFLPKLIPLANQMGITVEKLVGTHIHRYYHSSEPIECSINQIRDIVRAAEEAIEQSDKSGKLRRLIWCVLETEWSYDPDSCKQVRKLLVILLNSGSEEFSFVPLSVILFLKLLAYEIPTHELASHLFATLPLNQLLKLREFHYRPFLKELSSENLYVLKSFINHEDEVVRVGIALLLKGIIKAFVRYRGREVHKSQPLNNIRCDTQLGWSMVNSDETERRLAGISILSLSDYPVEDINYQNRLLTVFQQPKTAEEEEAWANFLKEIVMDNKYTKWLDLLKEILRQPWRYSNLILSTAMERYSTLVATDVTLSEAEEKALGLPYTKSAFGTPFIA
jgi:hypothetical protein